jgi:hypothetical protein
MVSSEEPCFAWAQAIFIYMGGVHRLDFACISGLIVSMLMIGQGATAYNSCTLLGYCTVRPFLECVNLAPGSLDLLILNISKIYFYN